MAPGRSAEHFSTGGGEAGQCSGGRDGGGVWYGPTVTIVWVITQARTPLLTRGREAGFEAQGLKDRPERHTALPIRKKVDFSSRRPLRAFWENLGIVRQRGQNSYFLSP